MAQTSIAIPPVFVTDARCSTTGGGVQGIGQRQVGYRLENDNVTWRVANVATVIISAESITDVKTCNGVRTASDEEVQNRRFNKLLNTALRSSSLL